MRTPAKKPMEKMVPMFRDSSSHHDILVFLSETDNGLPLAVQLLDAQNINLIFASIEHYKARITKFNDLCSCTTTVK